MSKLVVSMLHKIIEAGKTDDKCVISSLNILVMHVTKINCILSLPTWHADNYHRYYNHRDMHVGYHIWSRNHFD